MLDDSKKLLWFEREREKLECKKKRRYLHFDSRRVKLSSEIVERVCVPDFVLKHSFFPFIRYDKRQIKLKRIFIGKPKRALYKKRRLYFASHFDALIYSWYAFVLKDFYELELEKRGI